MSGRGVIAICALVFVATYAILGLSLECTRLRAERDTWKDLNDAKRVKIEVLQKELNNVYRECQKYADEVKRLQNQINTVQEMYDEDKVKAGAYVLRLLDEIAALKKVTK